MRAEKFRLLFAKQKMTFLGQNFRSDLPQLLDVETLAAVQRRSKTGKKAALHVQRDKAEVRWIFVKQNYSMVNLNRHKNNLIFKGQGL